MSTRHEPSSRKTQFFEVDIECLLSRWLSWLLFILGGCLILHGFFLLWLGLCSSPWPTAEARIIQSDVEQINSSEVGKPGFYVAVRYEFQVNHKTYVGNHIAVTPPTSWDQDDAKVLQKEYGVGKMTRVHYWPAWPRFCILEPGCRSWWGDPGVGLLLLVSGLVVRRENKKEFDLR